MNWKVTAVFGALLAVALGVYFLHSPDGGDTGGPGGGPKKNKLLPELIADRVFRIDILRKGETVTPIEKAADSVGDFWRIAPPVDKPVDLPLVRAMLQGVDGFLKTGGLEPGTPETAPEITGLADPLLVVTFHAPGRTETVRFGKQPPTNTTAVFFQKEGDPKIYLSSKEVFDAYDKPALALRHRQLTRFDPHKAVRVQIDKKITRVRQGDPVPVRTEYESSSLERLQGAEVGWWLVQPHRERLADLQVMTLLTDLAALPIEDWRPAGNLGAQGFDAPSDRVSVWLHGIDNPIVILFGDDTDLKRKRFAHVEGSGEVARIDINRYDRLLLQRNHLRPHNAFSFSRETVESFRLEVAGLGKVLIERQQKQNRLTGLVTSSWELLEPKNLKIEIDKIEGFVGGVLALQITKDGFLGPQDFKSFKLEPPAMTLEVKTRDGRRHAYGFTVTSAAGYMRREGVDEVFEVQPEMLRIMERLELNFLHPEVFNVPRDSLREFTFESKADLLNYTARFDPKTGKWTYVRPPERAGKTPNENILSGVLAVMNYVQSESFIGRGAGAVADNRLDERTAASVLTVVHEGGTDVFLIGSNRSEKVTRSIYYARNAKGDLVFQINAGFIEGLKRLGQD